MSTASRRRHLEDEVTQTMRISVIRGVLLNQAIAAQVGINLTDMQCISVLSLEGPMTPSRLAEAVAMTKGGAITAVVDRLEKAGYIRRTRDPHDRRQVLLEITLDEPLGRLVEYFEPAGDAFAHLLADYTDSQLQLVLEFVAQSNEAIKQVTLQLGGR